MSNQYLLWGIQYWALQNKTNLVIHTLDYDPSIGYDFVVVEDLKEMEKIPDLGEYQPVSGISRGKMFIRKEE